MMSACHSIVGQIQDKRSLENPPVFRLYLNAPLHISLSGG